MFKKKCKHDWYNVERINEGEIVSEIRKKMDLPQPGWGGGNIYYKQVCLICGAKNNEIKEAYDRLFIEETKRILDRNRALELFPEDSWEEIKSQSTNDTEDHSQDWRSRESNQFKDLGLM